MHGMAKLTSLLDPAKTAVRNWSGDFAPSMGAALAYYTVFSIAPLLIIAIAVAGLVFGQDAAQAGILDQARGLLGDNGAKAIEGMLASAQKPKQGLFASALGIVTLLIGATTVFAELESNLNRIWKVVPKKGSGLWNFVRTRLLSIGMVLAIGFLLLVSLIVSAFLAAWGKYWAGWFGEWETLLQAANFVVSVAIITVLFAILYKFMPHASVRWRDVWIGAFVTSLLFSFGKFLIGLYIGKSGMESSYGAAGALVVLLVWVYYSAQIFLLGAEFTRAQAARHESNREPEQGRDAARGKRAPRRRTAMTQGRA
jgi:membrane protein